MIATAKRVHRTRRNLRSGLAKLTKGNPIIDIVSVDSDCGPCEACSKKTIETGTVRLRDGQTHRVCFRCITGGR